MREGQPSFDTELPDGAGPAAQSLADSGLCFTLEQWRLWQSVECRPDTSWPCGEVLPCREGGADAGFLPLMQRRRLSPLAKAAISVAWPCRQGFPELPAVFSSSHGESRYYFEMLNELARSEALSPSRFSLSVHNAIAGLCSLYSETRAPYVAVAPGEEGVSAALLEAAGVLAERPEGRVLVVWYEQPLPTEYQSYTQGPDHVLALAMRLGAPSSHGPRLHVNRTPMAVRTEASPSCQLQRLGRAIADNERRVDLAGETALWRWSLADA